MSHKPVLLFLSEILVTCDTISELCVKFDFADYFVVDKVGRGGGLTILWRKKIV